MTDTKELAALFAATKVLVVDDFSINRTIVRQYLQPLGAQVFEASSAIQALVLIEEAAVTKP